MDFFFIGQRPFKAKKEKEKRQRLMKMTAYKSTRLDLLQNATDNNL
jgi:hypothetical protein